MFWSYDSRTYSDCRPCIVLSVLLHVKHIIAVYIVKTKTKNNLRWKHWRKYWHRCHHTCKKRLMHDIDLLPLNFNHTAVYAYIISTCDGPEIRMCAKSDNTAIPSDLMVI